MEFLEGMEMNKYFGMIIDVLLFAFALFICYLLWRFTSFFNGMSLERLLFSASCGWIGAEIIIKNKEKYG